MCLFCPSEIQIRPNPDRILPSPTKLKPRKSLDFLGNYNLDVGRPMCHNVRAESKETAGAPKDEIGMTRAMIEAGCEAAYEGGFPNEPTEHELVSLVVEYIRP
jgi:hypothetical protein